MHYVYAIQSADGPVKIGVASNPRKRLRSLQTGSPHPLALLGIVGSHYTRQGALRQEEAMHTRFAARRMAGEWFDILPAALNIKPLGKVTPPAAVKRRRRPVSSVPRLYAPWDDSMTPKNADGTVDHAEIGRQFRAINPPLAARHAITTNR